MEIQGGTLFHLSILEIRLNSFLTILDPYDPHIGSFICYCQSCRKQHAAPIYMVKCRARHLSDGNERELFVSTIEGTGRMRQGKREREREREINVDRTSSDVHTNSSHSNTFVSLFSGDVC